MKPQVEQPNNPLAKELDLIKQALQHPELRLSQKEHLALVTAFNRVVEQTNEKPKIQKPTPVDETKKDAE